MNNTKKPRRSVRAEGMQRAAAVKKATAAATAPKKVTKRRKATSKVSARVAAASKVEYEVSKIVDSKLDGKKRSYLVQWKGYNKSYNTWEPEEHLVNIQDKIKAFDVAFPDKP